MNKDNKLESKSALERSVRQFTSFFEQKLADIQAIDIQKSGNLFQKILYAGLLDALSKTVSSPKKGNRERLVSLLRGFSGWDKCDHISLPHLIRLLQKVPDIEFSLLREYAFSLYDNWTPGAILYLDKDPSFNDIKKLWPSNLPKPLEDIRIESFQHAHLFYSYRNNLIHELREPGYGMEFKESEEPFYHSMQELETELYTWELVYPVDFYRKLCETTLSELCKYYLRDRIDPYSCYTFGSYWLEALNT